jgi:hypothetical protein
MTSIKCRSCGLVNFSTERSCKRCKSPINGEATADERFLPFQSPPPPPTFSGDASAASTAREPVYPCIKCGGRQRTNVRSFVKIYNSPVAILGIFLGLLPYFILKILLRTKHNITGPFCEPCWARFQSARTTYKVANALLFLMLFGGGIVLSIYIDSDKLFLASILFPWVVLAAGSYYLTTLGPKYKRVNSKEVVIDAPHVGEIVYTR